MSERSIRATLTRRLRAACDAKGWTDLVLARRMGVHRRTVARAWKERVSMETLESMATVLGVDLDNDSHPETTERVRTRQAIPVVGWKAAADVLGVSTRTLGRVRSERGNGRRPWWKSPQALLDWFDGVVSSDESCG